MKSENAMNVSEMLPMLITLKYGHQKQLKATLKSDQWHLLVGYIFTHISEEKANPFKMKKSACTFG